MNYLNLIKDSIGGASWLKS